MKRCRIISLIITVTILTTGLSAQNDGRISENIILFGDRSFPPVVLDSERGWIPIAAVDWNSLDIEMPLEGVTRRWRLRTTYEHSRSSGPSTVQIRLRGPVAGQTFTHPWSEGADRKVDAYSNWFEDAEALMGREGRGYVEARLVAPPRAPLSGKLYSVTLEAWDAELESEQAVESPAGPDVQLAYTRPLPMARSGKSPAAPADKDAEDPELGIERALEFALSFVEACLIGDLPSYYRTQASQVRSLDDGMAVAKYRLNPPRGIPGIVGLEDYKRRYDYRIYDASVFSELFPEWFDTERPWIPNENSFLFMGHRDRLSGAFPEGVDYLVFLVETDQKGNWSVVARPGY